MFPNAKKLITLNRFEIRIDPSWLLIAALVTWTLSREFFPQMLPDASPTVYLAMAVCAMLGLFGSLILHELAHAFVARHYGIPIKNITLFLFGGVAQLGAEPPSARAEIMIAAAGPAMSFLLAASFWVLEYVARQFGLPAALLEIASYFALVNLVLALFNLLPAFPLDGGRILRALLWARSGDVLSATRIAAKTGAILGIFLMTLGGTLLIGGAIVAGLWQIMIGGFVLLAARASYLQELAKIAIEGVTVDTLMTKDPVTVSPDVTLSSLFDHIVLQKHLTFIPVLEGDVLLGYIDLSLLAKIDFDNWDTTRVGDVFAGLNQSATVNADLPIKYLYQQMAETGRRKFMVVSDHRLIGVITHSDLINHLAIVERHQRMQNSTKGAQRKMDGTQADK